MIRLALRIFCYRVTIKNKSALLIRGPVLITANHPNSFLDALIIGSLFNRPVHFLARGDVFRKPWHAHLLRLLNMIPVYRLSEGKENLSLNDSAFRRTGEILAANGIVLIFIEGICVHKHELQPFKKGAARIAIENKTIKGLHILPLGIAYDSFERFGKTININIGEPLLPQSLFPFEEEAKNTRNFNSVLYKEIKELIDVPSDETPLLQTKNKWLFLPAIAGYILHILFYMPIKQILKKKTRATVFLILYYLAAYFFCIQYMWCLCVFYCTHFVYTLQLLHWYSFYFHYLPGVLYNGGGAFNNHRYIGMKHPHPQSQ